MKSWMRAESLRAQSEVLRLEGALKGALEHLRECRAVFLSGDLGHLDHLQEAEGTIEDALKEGE